MTVLADLCRTWSETQIVCFLMRRLVFLFSQTELTNCSCFGFAGGNGLLLILTQYIYTACFVRIFHCNFNRLIPGCIQLYIPLQLLIPLHNCMFLTCICLGLVSGFHKQFFCGKVGLLQKNKLQFHCQMSATRVSELSNSSKTQTHCQSFCDKYLRQRKIVRGN